MTPDIKALMSSADWWEAAGYVASALVLIGIVMESIELIRLVATGRLREKWFEFAAVLVVVLGLAAEILTQVQSNNRTGLIIGALNAQSEDAKRQSAIAIKAAAELGVTVDNLTQVAQTKAGEANLAIAALNEATAKAAGKVATIEKIVTPRNLTPEQQKRIWQNLSEQNEIVPTAVFSTSGVFESAHLVYRL